MLKEVKCCRFTLARTLQSSVLYTSNMFVSRLQEHKVHCYLATRPEVEGFIKIRDQDFVLQIYLKQKAFEFTVLWLLKKKFTLKGGARHQFINREQQGTPSPALYLVHYMCNISPKHGSALNRRSNDFIRRYIEH